MEQRSWNVFQSLRCLLLQERWKRTSVRTVQPPSSLLWLCFGCALQQDKDNSSACRNVPSYKEWIWNWSFIGQYPYQAKDHWWSTSFKRLFYACWLFSNVSFTPLYKGVKVFKLNRTTDTYRQESNTRIQKARLSKHLIIYTLFCLDFKVT